MKEKLSPMMQHYLEVKEKYGDAIVFYRLGDFYEVFFDDAKEVSRILDLTLTGRACGLEERAPMCGVPYHAVDKYISKLVEAGKKIAICEQLSEPNGKTMVERDVIRVISAGTVMEDNMLDAGKNNFIASIFVDKKNAGLSWCDLSTGEFYTTEFDLSKNNLLEDFITTFSPSEIIVNKEYVENVNNFPAVKVGKLPHATTYYDWAYNYQNAKKRLQKQLYVTTLDSYELTDKKYSIISSGALIEYLLEGQKRSLDQINGIKYVNKSEFLTLDYKAVTNLEIFETLHTKKKNGSLFGVLDKTNTAMGTRQLRKWIEQPLQDENRINFRLDAVSELIDKEDISNNLTLSLKTIRDLERLAGKIAFGSVMPRDCLSINESLKSLPMLKNTLFSLNSSMFTQIVEQFDCMEDLQILLDKAISQDAPLVLKDGGYIKDGFNSELDEYRNLGGNAKNILAEIEAKEKELTGIKNLKIGYNKVFGYYIEVSKSNVGEVPFRYIRKQTLTTGERYITEELKVLEDKILSAEENSIKLEQRLFKEIVDVLKSKVAVMQKTAKFISIVDCINSFSIVSRENGYVRPSISKNIDSIEIEEGRHPVVEQLIGRQNFVSNDTTLTSSDNIMVITGPNMAGKSTYMRQIALIAIMAHVGCFVPCNSCKMPIIDRIFTRIGASDDLSVGQSTFMVEMVEVATILNNATQNSLLILDEIGRGTSTFDGLSIAWAVMEYIAKNIGAKTLFATHYHELTELEGKLKGVKNYRILIKELNNDIIFLHKIARGGANKSFGIEVAGLAGVPKEVIKLAKKYNKAIEKTNVNMQLDKPEEVKQLSLFVDSVESEVVKILRETNINNTTPIQALAILEDLKYKVEE